MKKHLIIDTVSGEVLQTMQWKDGRIFPSDIEIESGKEVMTILDDVVEAGDMYHKKTKKFYILDVTEKEQDIKNKSEQIEKMESELSEFQEATWIALGINENKLPKIWQDRLSLKRELKKQLLNLKGGK